MSRRFYSTSISIPEIDCRLCRRFIEFFDHPPIHGLDLTEPVCLGWSDKQPSLGVYESFGKAVTRLRV